MPIDAKLTDRPAPVITVDVTDDAYPGPGGVLAILNKLAVGAARAYADAAARAAATIVRKAFGADAHRALFELGECDNGDSACLHINLRLVTAADGAVIWYDNQSTLACTALVAARDEDEAYGGPVLPILADDTHQAIIDLIGEAEQAYRNYLDRDEVILDAATGERTEEQYIVLELDMADTDGRPPAPPLTTDQVEAIVPILQDVLTGVERSNHEPFGEVVYITDTARQIVTDVIAALSPTTA